MSSDRELLELAARAAGMPMVGKWCADGYELPSHDPVFDPVIWNPLTSDGDALRLAVKLGLQIRQYPIYDTPRFAAYVCEKKWSSDAERDIGEDAIEHYNGDPCAATRRAIVRAAAEIGRAMP